MTSNPSISIIVNAASGTVLEMGQESLRAKIEDSLMDPQQVDFVEVKDIPGRLQAGAAADETMIVGGGDGTIALAARHMMDLETPFGILPLGTMNLVARDLGIPQDIKAALDAYSHGMKQTSIDAACCNDSLFLCSTTIGAIPEASVFREEHRKEPMIIQVPRLIGTVLDRMNLEHQQTIRISIDNQTIRHRKYATVIVSNNTYRDGPDFLNYGLKRDSLSAGRLGVYTMRPRSFIDKIRLLFLFQAGFWKNDPIVREYKGSEVRIEAEGEEALISVDGEPGKESSTLTFSVLEQAVALYVPQ